MKKRLFFILSLMAMVFTMSALVSCGDDDDVTTSIRISNRVVVVYDKYNVDQATEAAIKQYEAALNQRVVKLFGSEYSMKYDENTKNIEENDFHAHNKRIDADSEFTSIIKKLAELKTADGKYGAVSTVVVYYYCGDKAMGGYEIS